MAAPASGTGWFRYYAWSIPAALALTVIGLLGWNAWSYGYDPHWLDGAGWWRPIFATDQGWTPVITMLLLVASLGAFWYPRRRDRLPIGLIAVVVLVLVAAGLGTVSYLPCRGTISPTGVAFWVLQLYVGQPPALYQQVSGPVASCQGTPPLGLQLAQVDGLGATVIGAIAAGSLLWQRPIGQLLSRFAYDVTIVTGLNELSLPVIRRLTETARRPSAVVVIEPDDKNPLLEDVRFTGARIVSGKPDSPLVLAPIICAWRGCALNHLYALATKAADNDAVIEEARRILNRYRADQDRQPHLVTRIDDPRHAGHWRSIHSGASSVWFEDAISTPETTARDLVSRVLRRQPRHLLVCGDSDLTLPILSELARRAWEQAELAEAAEAGCAGTPDLPPLVYPAPLPVATVTLLDAQARNIRREHRASLPRAVRDALPDIDVQHAPWQEEVLDRLDRMDGDHLAVTAVIIAEGPPESGMHVAGRIAQLYSGLPVYVFANSGHAKGEAIFALLHPFEQSLLVGGEVPEDNWTRIARHWHECYRLSHPLPFGHERAKSRLPWAQLGSFVRQDNVLQLHSVLAEIAKQGRRWMSVQLVPAGSIVELSEAELTEIAIAEHKRWVKHQLSAGRSGENVVDWERLPPQTRISGIKHLRTQLSQLEAVGFVPTIPAGGPPGAAKYERIGLVRASRLTQALNWTIPTGEVMRGRPGDWLVTDEAGNRRTVSDREFLASHIPVGDGTWHRVGTFTAWRVWENFVIRTKEGTATASPGDWVVESPNGERWPVRHEQFESTYQNVSRPDTIDGAGAAANVSG